MELFFGMGTGRTASMMIANLLNSEVGCDCLHEGKFRDMEVSGEQLLPFLTLQNRLAYERPDEAAALILQCRNQMRDMASDRGLKYFGDIAYNNSPFVLALHSLYPEAKFIFQFRDCLDFVRSCAAVDVQDEMPVGWPPVEKPLSKIERYIALGRLQPRTGTDEEAKWSQWDFVSKNIWLWAETNYIIISALNSLPKSLVHKFQFETFQKAPLNEYNKLREFIGITGLLSEEFYGRLTIRPINKRINKPDINLNQLTSEQRDVFENYAAPVRLMLGYS